MLVDLAPATKRPSSGGAQALFLCNAFREGLIYSDLAVVHRRAAKIDGFKPPILKEPETTLFGCCAPVISGEKFQDGLGQSFLIIAK